MHRFAVIRSIQTRSRLISFAFFPWRRLAQHSHVDQSEWDPQTYAKEEET